MKPLKNSIILLLGIALVTVTIISCKKDRIQSDDYQSMDSFYDNNKEQEQEYTIDSLGGNCYVTRKEPGSALRRICNNFRAAGRYIIPIS
jgi:hypothetical protein